MKFILTLCLSLLITTSISAQKKIKVLFIGNSYTAVNNLPQTVHDVALSNGDTLIFDSSTPGGYTFHQQTTYAPTLSKIAQGGWDYVVLQAQSQEPSFDPSQVATDTYPYAARLDSLIHAVDSCTETVFYLTWGKKNGDSMNCAVYPPVCTYTGCQDRLTESYLEMGQLNQATVSPAGEAWRKVIGQSHAFDLYQSDQSHPTVFGTYLTASVFYEMLFQKSVLGATFVTAGIPDSNAAQLRVAAHSTVQDSLHKWLDNGHIPVAAYTHSVNGTQVSFVSSSINGISFAWDYGDGHSGSGATASHTYASTGTYPVSLTVLGHCMTSVFTGSIAVGTSGLNDEASISARIYPEPASSVLHIDLTLADGARGYTISLINTMGQTIRRYLTYTGSSSVLVSDLADGIYVVVIKTPTAEYHYPVSVIH